MLPKLVSTDQRTLTRTSRLRDLFVLATDSHTQGTTPSHPLYTLPSSVTPSQQEVIEIIRAELMQLHPRNMDFGSHEVRRRDLEALKTIFTIEIEKLDSPRPSGASSKLVFRPGFGQTTTFYLTVRDSSNDCCTLL